VGVPFVEVDLGGWDTHRDNFPRVKSLSAVLDQGMSALLADLKARGLLERTLVVWMGDFGRTPQVKGNGRGHWPQGWTTLLCGAGLKTGQTVGRTDRQGGQVVERPVTINDFLATICKALGIDYTREFTTRLGRPMRVVDKGEKVITELFA
jgi:arylsulfatase A-like enzyme